MQCCKMSVEREEPPPVIPEHVLELPPGVGGAHVEEPVDVLDLVQALVNKTKTQRTVLKIQLLLNPTFQNFRQNV